MKNWTVGNFLWWFFIFPIYTVPTLLILFLNLNGTLNKSAWVIYIWGGVATAVGLYCNKYDFPRNRSR